MLIERSGWGIQVPAMKKRIGKSNIHSSTRKCFNVNDTLPMRLGMSAEDGRGE